MSWDKDPYEMGYRDGGNSALADVWLAIEDAEDDAAALAAVRKMVEHGPAGRLREKTIREAIAVCEEQAETARSEGEFAEATGCNACIEALKELLAPPKRSNG